MRIGSLGTLLPLVTLLAASARADDAKHLVDCWADAIGGRGRLATIASVAESGTFATGGLSGTYRTWSTARGDLRSDVDLGGYRATEAFSAGKGWSQEGSAPPHQAGPTDLARLTSEAYLESFSMFFADRLPGTLASRGRDPATGEAVLEIRPDGGLPLTVRLDPSSCLPRSIEQPDRDRTQRQTISSWRSFAGVRFPGSITQSTGDPKYDAVIRLEAVELNPTIAEATFDQPSAGGGVEWPEGRHSVAIPIELTENHIFVPVQIDGRPPSSFVLDSGADVSVVSKEHAQEIGLSLEGALEARGAGSGSLEASIVKGATVGLGGIELHPDLVFVVPLRKLSLREGRSLDGILGYDVLSRFVVRIDYAARRLTLFDPAGFTPPAEAKSIPVQFDGNTPTATVTIVLLDGRRLSGRVSLDTGNRSALNLNRPFVEKNHLLATSGPTIDAPQGMGIGGSTSQRIGRVAWLEIGPFRLADVVTGFSTDQGGSTVDPNLVGNVGGDTLRRFVVWIDYPHQRVLLAPGDDYREPFEFDMSGILFEYADEQFDRIVVHDVVAGSPAAVSGVKTGDVLVAFDGRPAAQLSLSEIRASLKRPGERHTLRIERGAASLDLVVTTRRVI